MRGVERDLQGKLCLTGMCHTFASSDSCHYISIYAYLRFKLFVCVCVCVRRFAKVCLPVQYLWGPFKTLQGITAAQSSVSACDSIVSGPRSKINIFDYHSSEDGVGRHEEELKETDTPCEGRERQNRRRVQALQLDLNLL